MTGKVCLITGATSGIGRAAAHALAQQGAEVVLGARNAQKAETTAREIKEETGNQSVHTLLADLASLQQTRKMAEAFKDRFERLDVLVNNAGVFIMRRKESDDGYERSFAVNHLSHFLLTHLLLDVLKKTAEEEGEARIVNVASGAHFGGTINFDDLQSERGYGGMAAYAQSKLANVLFTYELARRLKDSNITVNAMHPGFVATGFAKNNGVLARLFMPLASVFARSPEKGAETAVYLAASPEVRGVTGKYFKDKAPKRSSQESYDEEVAQKLWDVSAELVGLEHD